MCDRVSRTLVLVVGWCLIGIYGCGGADSGRCEISGTIKLKGAPLNEGVIEFHPVAAGDPGSGNPGSGDTAAGGGATKSGTVISAGTYVIPKEDGLVPGRYRVLITSGDGQTPANPDEIPGPTGNFVSTDRIPAEYNVDTKQVVEVTADKPNVFNFDIP